MNKRILFLLSIILLSHVAHGQTIICKQDFIIREDIVATGQNPSDTACVQITLLADLEIQPQSSYHALIVSDGTGRTIGRAANLHPTISPLSPNSAAIERFGSHPVNLSSGLASQPIPLFDIQVGSISLPISINNHHGGQKVGEVASWVGTGMALNAGSPITRQITGRPDEYLYSYLEGSVQSSYSTTDPNVCANNRAELGRIVRNERDSGADIFNFNGGKFIFVPNSSEVLTLPASKNKIEYHRVNRTYIEDFKVTDEQGIRYSYRNKENANAYSGGITTSANNAWMLNNIEGTNPTERIELSYDSTIIQNNFDYQDVQVLTEEVSNCGIPAGLDQINSTSVVSSQKIQQLKEIKFPSGKAVFVRESSPRQDLDNAFALDKIEIYSYELSSNSYALVRTYDLVYTYYDTYQNANGNLLADGGKRLFLTQVRLLDADGVLQGQYELNYNTATPLPKYLSRGRDMWGYYNGQDNNTSLIPQQTVSSMLYTSNPNYVTLTVGSANREPNESFMKAMVLTRMKYPTGGYSDFEYEANRYKDNSNNIKIAGGLRIAKIKTYTSSTAAPITKTYQYGSDGTGRLNVSLLHTGLSSDMRFETASECEGSTNGLLTYRRRTFGNAYTSLMQPYDGTTVYYPTVTETEHEGSDYIGKNIITFEDHADVLVQLGATSRIYLDSYHWLRGQLKQKETYNKSNQLQYMQVVSNSTLTNQVYSSYPMGVLVAQPFDFTGYPFGQNNCGPYNRQGMDFISTGYGFRIGLSKSILVQEYFYHNGNTNEYQYKETATDYSPNHYFPIETRTLSNDNEQFINRMRYAQDLDPNTLNGGGLAEGWRMLVAKNEYKPIESVTLLRKNNPVANSSTTVIDGQLNTFRSQNNEAVADKIYTLAVGDGSLSESVFYFATANGSTINYHPSYIEQVNFSSYDSNNNLTDWTSREGVAQHYNWNTLNIGSLKLSLLQSEVKGYGTSLAQTTQYGYQKPLLGLSQITDPSGRNSYFEYERYGRLGLVKDHNGNILSQHQYGYATGVAGQNKVVSQQPRVAMTTVGGNYTQVQTQTSFSDGIGRPTHSLIHNGTADASKDLVTTATTYDLYSRVSQSYLPFPSPTVGGVAVTDFQSPAQGFYADNFPYNQTQYEESPLGRPTMQFGAGQAWRTANKFTETKYFNVISGVVRKYKQTTNGAVVNGTWNGTDLVKKLTISERGKEVVEYTDKNGKVVQKDVQDDVGYMTTAYIYDDFERLKYIIQPQAFATAVDFVENDNYFKAGVFAYNYDKYNRMIASHVPSGDWTYNVYDKRDKKVLEQTALEKQLGDRWKFIKYDVLNRPVQTGELVNAGNQSSLQAAFENISSPFEVWNGTDYSNQSYPISYNETDLKTTTFYDNYSGWLPASGTPMTFDASNAYHSNFSNATGLMTGSKVRSQINGNWLLSANYYDDKKRVIQNFAQNLYGQTERTDLQLSFVGEVLKTREVKKNQAGTATTKLIENDLDHVGRVKALYQTIDNGPRLKIATYNHDNVGRLIQKKILPDGTYIVGGTPASIIRPPNPNGGLTQDLATQFICLQPGVTITGSSTNTYLAQVVAGNSGSPINGLQTIDFQYHIRGGLRGINLDATLNPIPNTLQGDLFAFKLDYEGDGTYFDGNIRKQTWHNGTTQRNFLYGYDASSRLKSAIYSGINSEDYSLPNINYDKNGNITQLQRNGKTGGSAGSPTFGLMDNLTYYRNGNRLSQITDAISGNHDVDFVQRSNAGYSFYNDGSLKFDDNEQISNIIYDSYLKQPIEIQLTDGRKINHYYDGGNTLLKTIYSTGEYWEFSNGMVYKNGADGQPQPYQMAMPEGRLIWQNNNWQPEFDIKDHLENTRVSFRANGNQLEKTAETSFDPWGVTLKDIGQSNNVQNRWEMQGKEKESTFGLNRINFGARTLNQTTGIWDRVDMMAEKYYSISPFSFVSNMPLLFSDPTGNDIEFGMWEYRSVSPTRNKWTYKKVELGNLDKNIQNAIRAILKTNVGLSYFSQFAKAGDKIGDTKFEKTGVLSKHTLVISERGVPGGFQGLSDIDKGDNGLRFEVRMNRYREDAKESNFTEPFAITLGHELFLHIDQDDSKAIQASKNPKTWSDFVAKKEENGIKYPGGSDDHYLYLKGDKRYRKMYQYINQLKTVLNPGLVESYRKKHDDNLKTDLLRQGATF